MASLLPLPHTTSKHIGDNIFTLSYTANTHRGQHCYMSYKAKYTRGTTCTTPFLYTYIYVPIFVDTQRHRQSSTHQDLPRSEQWCEHHQNERTLTVCCSRVSVSSHGSGQSSRGSSQSAWHQTWSVAEQRSTCR